MVKEGDEKLDQDVDPCGRDFWKEKRLLHQQRPWVLRERDNLRWIRTCGGGRGGVPRIGTSLGSASASQTRPIHPDSTRILLIAAPKVK